MLSPEPAGPAPLARFFQDFPQRRYIMFGGKGGLGKTTFSAATAYYLARRGHKVLVFSVDPQASLSDIFQQDIYGRGPVEIIPGLFAQEIDADRHIKEYQDQIRRKILEMYGFDRVPEEIEHYIAAASAEPAMEESAIFDQVVDIVVAGQYDYFIYDLVPLGHALYYLSMASVYDEWIERITRLRQEMQQYAEMAARFKGEQLQEDLILQELQDIRQRITTSSRILTDQARTAFFFVIIPEEMVLLDTQKAAQLFSRFQVPISGYIVNRVLPEALAKEQIPDYLQHRLQMQQGYLHKISDLFGGQVLAWIPEFERDVTGLEMIARMAEAMFGGDGGEPADR
ncbi:MAG: TRC40/GET3/ArsA family transport-energizing ATPase [Armatimonadota bacterium]|nr:TRC40/GET3/ArsA family transport-energizing ATPase [Armatimonadota bacterium]MDR7426585.1 TRC40/GET3/ArsA family transport-energizing ATPase [Armatimonadota bacterium]MDR7463684.1 TRC40/GET3/ArsA family transport-energizing ATPase [Armatimonadota bacterium]MDR7468605.1 TRC40/GET3/ArsA family transport-energizing ATPase [Armatimonadota bacterium]MDR7473728.1 TRC40/GET3/ArsA family transport-energizing ATPase [Armatimonadota bacterium]